MFELTAAIGDLSTPVKIGWTLWFAWGIVSLGWYRHARVVVLVAPAPSGRFVPAPANTVMEAHQEDLIYTDPTGSHHSDSAAASAATQ